MENYQRHQSVWNLVKEHVPDSELPEIRAVLGDALIDMHTEMYSEVETWEQIWNVVRRSKQGERPKNPCSPLADAPAIKELLKAEVQLLLLALRERAARAGRDGDAVMSRYSPGVVSYALGSSRTERLGSPSRQCDTRKTPSRPSSSQSLNGSRSSSRLSSSSGCEDDIEAMRHQLNVSRIDEVVAHLRSVLTEDCEALRREVQFLQESVEQEHQTDPELQEPTVTELKEERKLIQKDLKLQSLDPRRGWTPAADEPVRDSARGKVWTGLSADDLTLQKRSTSAVPSKINPPHTRPCPPLFPRTHLPDGAMSQSSAPGTTRYTQGPIPRPGSDRSRRQSWSSDLPDLCPSSGASRTPSPEGYLRPLATSGSTVPEQSPLDPCTEVRDSRCSGPVTVAAQRLSLCADSVSTPLPGTSGVGTPVCPTQRRLRTKAARDSADPTKRLSHGPLLPTPPAAQKPASRGQSVTRRLCLPQGDSLVR